MSDGVKMFFNHSLKGRLFQVGLLIAWVFAMFIKYTPVMMLSDNKGNAYFNYIAAVCILLSIITFIVLLLINSDRFILYAVLLLLGYGLCYILALTPFSRPDDDYHFNSALMVSNMIMGEKDLQYIEEEYLETDRFVIRKKITPELQATIVDRRSEDYILHILFAPSYIREIQDVCQTNRKVETERKIYATDRYDYLVNPAEYLPAAFGITIGRLLHLSFTLTYWMGEVFNLLAYILIIVLSMKIFGRLKEMILLVASIPMNFHQAASFSYDMLLNAMSILIISYLLYLYHEADHVHWKETLITLVIAVIFVPIKVVYGVFLALFWFIPISKFRGKIDRLLKCLCISIIPFAFAFLARIEVIITKFNPYTAHVSGMGAGKVVCYGINDIFNTPGKILMLFIRTIVNRGKGWFLSIFGYSMAGLSIYISTYLIYGCIIILVLAIWYYSSNMPGGCILFNSVMFITCLCGISMVIMAMYVCTPNTSGLIQGVQGRYFIPFLFPFIACFSSKQHNGKITGIVNTSTIYYFWGLIQIGVLINILHRISN